MDVHFSYPVSSYTEHGRKLYVYRCNRCQKEVAGYRNMRVRGHITCFSCKKEIAKQKYNARKTEVWNLATVRYKGRVNTVHMEAEKDWFGDCSGGEVIAWNPLPKPYQQKGECEA